LPPPAGGLDIDALAGDAIEPVDCVCGTPAD
jgi:hypothetical protein